MRINLKKVQNLLGAVVEKKKIKKNCLDQN
jgi:hypothetical protein